MHRSIFIAGLVIALIAGGLRQRPAPAIPVFAHRYGVSCQTCHTIIPRLNAFGEAFMASGFRWPANVPQHGTFPVAAKENFAYSSQSGTMLPKAYLDEVEFITMGNVGNHVDYRFEQYWVDGGFIGKVRDAYVEYLSDPMAAWHGSPRPQLDVQAGEFTLPVPDDPETQRPTENHYAVFDQTVGANRFNFFDDRIGANVGLGLRGVSLNVLALKGHDPQSGFATDGTDTMAIVRLGPAPLTFSAYAYRGSRPLGIAPDSFVRDGFALGSILGKARTSLLIQTGEDSSADGAGTRVHSSGGYLQEEWAFSDRWIGAARYDGTSQPSMFLRSATLALTYRPYSRAHLRIEDVFQTSPHTMHTLNAAWMFAY